MLSVSVRTIAPESVESELACATNTFLSLLKYRNSLYFSFPLVILEARRQTQIT